MKVEIDFDTANEIYHWKFWDGPDGIDYFEGTELDLGQCFESIVETRLMNSLYYRDDNQTIEDVLKQFWKKRGIPNEN